MDPCFWQCAARIIQIIYYNQCTILSYLHSNSLPPVGVAESSRALTHDTTVYRSFSIDGRIMVLWHMPDDLTGREMCDHSRGSVIAQGLHAWPGCRRNDCWRGGHGSVGHLLDQSTGPSLSHAPANKAAKRHHIRGAAHHRICQLIADAGSNRRG